MSDASLVSQSGRVELFIQPSTAQLCLPTGGGCWPPGQRQASSRAAFLAMQKDGNLCLYNGTGPQHNLGNLWCRMMPKCREGAGHHTVTVDDDSHLIVSCDTDPVWKQQLRSDTSIWSSVVGLMAAIVARMTSMYGSQHPDKANPSIAREREREREREQQRADGRAAGQLETTRCGRANQGDDVEAVCFRSCRWDCERPWSPLPENDA